MIGRADIEGSKSNVAMGAWLPQVSSCIPVSFRHFLRRSATPLVWTVGPRRGTVSSGSSSYLKHFRTHILPSVEPSDLSLIGCWLSHISDYYQCHPYNIFGTDILKSFQHPDMLPLSLPLYDLETRLLGMKPGTVYVYPSGDFSDTSSLKLVKLKDQ